MTRLDPIAGPTAGPIPQVCGSCKWWDVEVERHLHGSPSSGACHRFPPTMLIYETSVGSESPHTSDDDWCGEWSQARAKVGGNIYAIDERGEAVT